MAYFYNGEHLASQEAGSAGKAVKALETSMEHLKKAATYKGKLLGLYPEAKGKTTKGLYLCSSFTPNQRNEENKSTDTVRIFR